MASLKKRAFVALDGMNLAGARTYLSHLSGRVLGVKHTDVLDENAREAIRLAREYGLLVWADVKLHDVPTTVGNRAYTLALYGADIVTVQAAGGAEMVEAAVKRYREGRNNSGMPRGPGLGIVAVTVLTSMSEDTCWRIYGGNINDVVARMANEMMGTGIYGLVCSPLELTTLRDHPMRSSVKIATPGVYFEQEPRGRHSRYDTIANALANGADYVVMGNEIINARDPVSLITRIDASIAHIP